MKKLEDLPEDDKTILELRCYNRLRMKEIAEKIGKTESAAKTALFRARQEVEEESFRKKNTHE